MGSAPDLCMENTGLTSLAHACPQRLFDPLFSSPPES